MMPRTAERVHTNWLVASMPEPERAVFHCRFSALRDTAAFVEGFCQRHGVHRDDALRLRLVVEELFTNTVRHGHGCESDAPICVALSALEGRVALVYEDNAPPYNPLTQTSAAGVDPEDTVSGRSVGGLGILLVRELAASAHYAYEDGRNRLRITLERHAGGGRN
jgi:serine/threonine-protein kinase RsbW